MRAVKTTQHPDVADILLRVSSQGQATDDRFSLPTQEGACRRFCEQRGWRVHAVRQDAITGEVVERPGFQAVLADLAAGNVGRVVVYDVDRAGRDTYVGATLLHACKDAGATLHIERMPDLDLTSSMGEAMFFFRLTQAAQELASTRERTQRGRRARVQSGKPIIGPVPLFGYTFNGDKSGYVSHPDYAPVVLRIYEDVAAGRTLQSIADALTAEGIPPRSRVAAEETARTQAAGIQGKVGNGRRRVARVWHPGAVQDIVSNPTYAGSPVAYRFAREHRQVRDELTGEARWRWVKLPRAEGEQVALPTSAWPPLVSPELAARARARLDANRQEASRRLADTDVEATLLRGGYIFCATCGTPMTTLRQKRNTPGPDGGRGRVWAYGCNRCRQSGHAAPIDALVWRHVERLAGDDTVAERAVRRWQAGAERQLAARAQRLEAARRVAAQAQADSARLLRAVTREDDERAQDAFRAEWKLAKEHEREAREKLAALEAEDAANPVAAQLADVRAWAADWRGRVSDADWRERRMALHRLGLRVFLWPTSVRDEATGEDIPLESRESLLAELEGRGLREGESTRVFAVVLGWPQGVRRATPWTCEPLTEARAETTRAPLYTVPAGADGLPHTEWLVPPEEWLGALGTPGELAAMEGRALAALGGELGAVLTGGGAAEAAAPARFASVPTGWRAARAGAGCSGPRSPLRPRRPPDWPPA